MNAGKTLYTVITSFGLLRDRPTNAYPAAKQRWLERVVDDDASFGEGATQMDDGGLRRSIEVLIEAVAKEVKPGGFELKLAASTLRDLLQDPNPRSYSEAARAFAALDAETRRRIQANAESTATIYCTDSGRRVVVPHPKPQGEKVQRGGLLQALKVGFGSIIGKDRGAKR